MVATGSDFVVQQYLPVAVQPSARSFPFCPLCFGRLLVESFWSVGGFWSRSETVHAAVQLRHVSLRVCFVWFRPEYHVPGSWQGKGALHDHFPVVAPVVVVVRGGLMTQWAREVLKVKKKDTGATKVAARMLPSGAKKPRRGGWCECCERQYIGTMSEVSRSISCPRGSFSYFIGDFV